MATAEQKHSFVEDRFYAFEKYDEPCLVHMLETALAIVNGPLREMRGQIDIVGDWQIVLFVEEWLDKQTREGQKDFIRAYDQVVKKNERYAENHVDAKGIVAALDQAKDLSQHLKAVLESMPTVPPMLASQVCQLRRDEVL